MAITNAQQYKQLVNPPLDGKRPGYRGDAAYASKSEQSRKEYGGQGQTAAERGDPPGSTRDYGENYGSTPNTDTGTTKGNIVTYDPDEALATAKAQGAFDKPNFFESLLTARRRPIYNIFPNNPKTELRFISRLKNYNPEIYNRLPKNIKDRYEETIAYDEDRSFKDFDKFSFDDFEALGKFKTGLDTPGLENFAEYAATYGGAPGLKYSGNVGNLEKYVTGKDPITGETMYGYRERSDGGGGDGIMSDYERRLLELENQLKTQQAAAPTTTQNPFAYRFFEKGGRVALGGGSDMGTVADSKGNVGPSKGGYQGGGTGPVERPSGGGGDNNNNNQPPQKINIPKPIKDVGNTAGELMFLKNVFELNPVGIMKNIGTKMFLDNLISEADTQQNQNMMLADVSQADLDAKKEIRGFQDMDYDTYKSIMEFKGGTNVSPFEFKGLQEGTITEPGRYTAADGGIMNADMIGGMMDGNMDEMGRQMYGLGKLVKKATRGIKKIAKSPLGKVALLAGLNFAPTLFGKSTVLQGLGGMFKSEGLKKFFLKDATKKFALDNLSQKGLMTGIGALSALPLLFGQEEEEDFDPYRGPDIDIAAIRGDPYGAMGGAYRFAADGGIMRPGYQEGGDAEPVAKKTMPLIDMDGKEKDYRETGGFVDMGRMERADDVPARLSKNEFVFTADAVRNAGEGDIDKGAEVMYNMMKNLEAGGEVSEESQGLEGARNMFQTSQRLGEVI